jgi:hypothetical protein
VIGSSLVPDSKPDQKSMPGAQMMDILGDPTLNLSP